jgi:hypothetical protein
MHAAVYNTFNVQRHLSSAQTHRALRTAPMTAWHTTLAAAQLFPGYRSFARGMTTQQCPGTSSLVVGTLTRGLHTPTLERFYCARWCKRKRGNNG